MARPSRPAPAPRRGPPCPAKCRAALSACGWLLLVGACGPPAVDQARPITDEGPPPVILPLDEVLAQTDVPGLEPTDTAALQARAAGLQARAAGLSAAEVDPATRARLDAALEAKNP